MSHAHWLWIALCAYSIHMLEEHQLNWRDWARSVLRLPVDWVTFFLANSIVVVIGICCASVGWLEPGFALAMPALMLVNATLFHVAPTIVTRVYSPGLATAVVLFYPVAGWTYYGAWLDGVLTGRAAVISLALGTAMMASPIVLLRIKDLRWFQYPVATPSRDAAAR